MILLPFYVAMCDKCVFFIVQFLAATIFKFCFASFAPCKYTIFFHFGGIFPFLFAVYA